MHYGLDSVDLRLKRKTFTHVQSYFPNCHVIVQNLELAVQQAEAQMFPKKTREQDKWMRTVVQSVLPWVGLGVNPGVQVRLVGYFSQNYGPPYFHK